MNEEFERYLSQLGRLYIQGVTADVHPNLLRRLGGTLALAGRDAQWIRVEEDAALGVIDMRRSHDDILRIARNRWREHRRQIESAIENGTPPARAVESYIRSRTQTPPHSPVQISRMLQPVTGAAGTSSAWYYDIADFRRRLQRGADVMTGSSFTSIAAGAYFIATANDWENGTPEEWERALAFGEAVQPLANLAEGAAGIRQARIAPQPRSTAQGPRVVITDRGTGSSARGVTPRSRGSVGSRGTSTTSQRSSSQTGSTRSPASSRIDPEIDAQVERSIGPDSAYDRGPMQGIDRQGRRLVDRGGTGQPHQDRLDFQSSRQRRSPSRAIAALSSLGLNQGQIQVARRFIGRRLDGRFLRHWSQANNAYTRREMQRVRALERQGRTGEARALARRVYNNYRDRFWNSVRSDQRLVHMLEQAGLRFSSTGVPYYQLPRGRKEYLTLEHSGRVHDIPSHSVQGNQLLFVLSRENSGMLEGLRDTPYARGERGL